MGVWGQFLHSIGLKDYNWMFAAGAATTAFGGFGSLAVLMSLLLQKRTVSAPSKRK